MWFSYNIILGQMRMNSTTVSSWEVMEANSLFGIGEKMGHVWGGKFRLECRKIWICMWEVGSWKLEYIMKSLSHVYLVPHSII